MYSKREKQIVQTSLAGLLIAVGIIIPMFSPVKIPLGPAGSFTLASHVAIFIAMFVSPYVAIAVAVGTTAGFFFAGFPIVIVFRAASHLIFAAAGALYLHRVTKQELSALKLRIYSAVIAIIHALAEVIVSAFFIYGGTPDNSAGFFMTIIVSVGFVTILHSLVDFEIANLIMLPLRKTNILQNDS